MVVDKTDHATYRLAMVLFRYFPWGGMQRNFLRIAEACQQRGHQVDVMTLDWQGDRPKDLRIRVVDVGQGSNIQRYTRFFTKLPGVLSARPYDLVMGFNRMPGLDLYYAADPCFVERVRKTRPWYYPLTPRYRHFSRVEKDLFGPESSTRVLALSELQIEEYRRNYHTQAARFTLLPPGVQSRYRRGDDAEIVRGSFREQYAISDGDWVLLMIGSGFSRKGFDRGLRAVAALSKPLREKCRIFVVGKGREKSLLRLAKRLGLAQRLIIIPGSDELPRFMQGADLLLHPARSENTGNVIVEAIAAGLPVLCTEHCGYAVHVRDGQAGCCIPEPFKQEEMGRLLTEMLIPGVLNRMSENALAYAQQADLYSRLTHAVAMVEQLAEATQHA